MVGTNRVAGKAAFAGEAVAGSSACRSDSNPTCASRRASERWRRRTRTRRSMGWLAAVAVALAVSMIAASASAMAAGKVALSDADDPVAGQFIVAVVGSDGSYIVEPSFVDYKEHQTAQAALEASPYEFKFNGGLLVSVRGKAEIFSYCSAMGGGTMLADFEASEITSLAVSSNDAMGYLGSGHNAALDAIARYENGSRGLHNYPDAVNARKAAQQGFRSATDEAAATLANNLNTAIDKYEEYISGQKYTVKFNVTKGGAPSSANIVLTDAYGNETEVEGGQADVVAGTYSYEAMDSTGKNGVRCTGLVVDDTISQNPIAVALPEANWFGSIDLQVGQADKADCAVLQGSVAQRSITYAVPDAVKNQNDLFVYATPSDEVKKEADYAKNYEMYALYTGSNGNDYTQPEESVNKIAFESHSYASKFMVDQNLDGNDVSFEIMRKLSSSAQDGTVYQVEVCDARIERCPTLGSLSAVGDGLEYISGFNPFKDSYDVVTASPALAIEPQGFVAGGDYSCTVAGTVVGEDGEVEVEIPSSAYSDPYEVPVTVALPNGTSKTYTLNVSLKDVQTMTLTHDSNVSVQAYNAAGSRIAAKSGGEAGSTSTTFDMIDGQTYSYISTKNAYSHASDQFTAVADGTVAAATPHDDDIADYIKLGRSTLFNKEGISYEKVAESDHAMTFSVPDVDSTAWFLVMPKNTAKGVRVKASFGSQSDGSAVQIDVASKYEEYLDANCVISNLYNFTRKGGYGNSTVLQVYEGTKAATSGPEYYQDYSLTAARTLSLASMGVTCDTATVAMIQTSSAGSDAPIIKFDSEVLDYTVGVPQGTTSLNVRYMFTQPLKSGDVCEGGYHGTLAGVTQDYSASSVKQTIELDPTQEHQVFDLVVTHDDDTSTSQTYTIRVNQLPAASVSFDVAPSDASVGVVEVLSGSKVYPNDDGTYTLIDTYDYTYTVACSGYKGVSGKFTATDGLKIEKTLEKAEENPNIDPTIEAEWPLFRADSNNNSVVSAKTPTSSSNTLLYWATKLGKGYDKEATGCPILVDGYLYTYARDQIFKLDTVSGEVVARGTMVGISNFAITPMTYAEGMVFVALSNGRVQAFNADTLESLWVYTSANGGQPNCPISYADGKVYTGFWNKPNSNTRAYGDFVCLTITDEDPSQTKESKVALWEYYNEGGFYWAGSYACDDFVVVGSDNGSSEAVLDMTGEDSYSGTLYSFDTKTGKIIDSITEYPGGVNIGNIRSTPVYDPDTSRMYWVGRGGWFCSAKIGADGVFDKSTVTVLRLENNNANGQLSSTATPVICNGRAYVGADAGSSYAGVESGHCINVIDLATNTIAYKVPVGGRPQSSAVCSTAYTDSEGYAYVYFVDNHTPGKVRYVKDKPGQTSAITSTIETATDGKKYSVADVLFCPAQSQQQYCICSPIVDQYGTIYIKNDSAYMMAIGSTIEKVEITTPPDRTDYEVGETFDPAGMKVTATYSNGATRDITNYVEYQTETFEIKGKQTLEVRFPYTMYQNDKTDGQVGTEPDYNFKCPTDTLELNVVDTLPPQITTTALPEALAKSSAGETPQSYEASLDAIGTMGECKWTFEGKLPQGISFDASTATLSGVAAEGTGGAYELRFTLSNPLGSTSKTLTLTVNERPRVQSGAMASGMQSVSYSQRLQLASGYPAKANEWKLVSGSLPDGLELSSDTGTISGIPTKAGTYRFAVGAKNSVGYGPGAYVTIVIDEYTEPAAITTSSVESAEVGAAYSASFSASGVPAKFAWSCSGALPEGLTFDASTATISGTPAVGSGGAYLFSLSVDNGVGKPSSKNYVMRVYEDPDISSTALRDAAVGFGYWQKIGTMGYPVDFEWSVVSDALPEGLSLDASTGVVSGTPVQQGSYTFGVKATSKSTGKSASKTLSLEVGTTSPAAIVTDSLPNAQVGSQDPYEVQLQATGAPASFEWSVEGELPSGISFDAGTGTLSGLPAVGSGEEYDLTFTVSNGTGTDAKTLTLTVEEAPTLITKSLAAGFAGSAYTQQLEVAGYPEVSVAVEGLPDGLEFDSDTLVISGKPSAAGRSQVQIEVRSELGVSTQTLELVARGYERLAGTSRIDTMEEIVKTAFVEDRSARYIIVATGWNYADALTASALAGIYDAPIVTVDGGDTLSEQAARQIERLARGDTIVFVAGGEGVVSNEVYKQIEALSGVFEVERLAGAGRIETGRKIYEEGRGQWGDACVVANAWAYPDALSIGAFCANNAAPIFGASDGVLSDEQVSDIQAGGFSKVVIVGGDAAVNASRVKSQLGYDKQYVVLAGEGRIQTSQQIVEWECGLDASRAFAPCSAINVDDIAIANAWNYADALTGVSMSIKFGSPIMLVGGESDSRDAIDSVVGGNRGSITRGWILGGNAAVNFETESWFAAALKE